MPATFVEKAPHERGFAAIFDKEIRPEIERLERQRQRLLKTAAARGAAFIAILAAIITLSLVIPVDPDWKVPITMMITLLVAVIGLVHTGELQKRYKSSLRRVLTTPAAEFMGVTYRRNPGFPRRIYDRHAELGVLLRGCRPKFEDLVEGEHRDTAFRMIEVRLIRGSGRSSRVVFRGVVLEIDVPRAFSCRVLMDRRTSTLKRLGARLLKRDPTVDMTRLHTGNPAFERRFHVFTDDPDEAAGLLTPAFRATMAEVARDFRGPWRPTFSWRRAVTAGFAEGRFLLALPLGGGRFEVGSLLRSAYACERDVRHFLADVAIAKDIIDRLHGVDGGA